MFWWSLKPLLFEKWGFFSRIEFRKLGPKSPLSFRATNRPRDSPFIQDCPKINGTGGFPKWNVSHASVGHGKVRAALVGKEKQVVMPVLRQVRQVAAGWQLESVDNKDG